MVLYQLGVLADRLEHDGRVEQALRVRILADEIRRLVVDETGTDSIK